MTGRTTTPSTSWPTTRSSTLYFVSNLRCLLGPPSRRRVPPLVPAPAGRVPWAGLVCSAEATSGASTSAAATEATTLFRGRHVRLPEKTLATRAGLHTGECSLYMSDVNILQDTIRCFRQIRAVAGHIRKYECRARIHILSPEPPCLPHRCSALYLHTILIFVGDPAVDRQIHINKFHRGQAPSPVKLKFVALAQMSPS